MKRVLLLTILLLLSPIPARAISVSPTLIDNLSIRPGASSEAVVNVVNETDSLMNITTSIQEFIPKGEEGQQEYLSYDIDGITGWVKLPRESFALEPKSVYTIPVVVEAPSDAQPGGYYLTLFFETTPSSIDGGIGLVTTIGIPFLINVEGRAREKGNVVEFYAGDHEKFFTELPIEFTARIGNDGEKHILPQGTIYVKNSFGFNTTRISINQERKYVLPGGVRRISATWESTRDIQRISFFGKVQNEWEDFAIGRFVAFLDLEYADGERTVHSQYSFWVIPWHLLLLVLVGIVSLRVLQVFIDRRRNGGKIEEEIEEKW